MTHVTVTGTASELRRRRRRKQLAAAMALGLIAARDSRTPGPDPRTGTLGAEDDRPDRQQVTDEGPDR